jgi:hypothetical protein
MTEEASAGNIWEGRGADVSENVEVEGPELDEGRLKSGGEYREPYWDVGLRDGEDKGLGKVGREGDATWDASPVATASRVCARLRTLGLATELPRGMAGSSLALGDVGKAEEGRNMRLDVAKVEDGELASTDMPVVLGDNGVAMMGAGMVWRLRYLGVR